MSRWSDRHFVRLFTGQHTGEQALIMSENEDLTRRQGPVANAPASHNLAGSGTPPAVPAPGGDAVLTGILDNAAKSGSGAIGSTPAPPPFVRPLPPAPPRPAR